MSLQVIGVGNECLLVPLHQEAGAVPQGPSIADGRTWRPFFSLWQTEMESTSIMEQERKRSAPILSSLFITSYITWASLVEARQEVSVAFLGSVLCRRS